MAKPIHERSRYYDLGDDFELALRRAKHDDSITLHLHKDLMSQIGVAFGDRVDLFSDAGVFPDSIAIGKVDYGGSKYRRTAPTRGSAQFPLPREKVKQFFPDDQRLYVPLRHEVEDSRLLWFSLPPGKTAIELEDNTASSSPAPSTIITSGQLTQNEMDSEGGLPSDHSALEDSVDRTERESTCTTEWEEFEDETVALDWDDSDLETNPFSSFDSADADTTDAQLTAKSVIDDTSLASTTSQEDNQQCTFVTGR